MLATIYFSFYLVVQQAYDVFVESEHVIVGNDALMKCKIPSYVTDLISIVDWVNSEGSTVNFGTYYYYL